MGANIYKQCSFLQSVFIEVGQRLGIDKYKYIDSLGFSKPTGVDLPGGEGNHTKQGNVGPLGFLRFLTDMGFQLRLFS